MNRLTRGGSLRCRRYDIRSKRHFGTNSLYTENWNSFVILFKSPKCLMKYCIYIILIPCLSPLIFSRYCKECLNEQRWMFKKENVFIKVDIFLISAWILLKFSGHLELFKLHLINTKNFRYQLPFTSYCPLKIYFELCIPDKLRLRKC